MQANSLLPADDRPNADLGGLFQKMVHRIAEDDFDALALQDFDDRLACLDDASPLCLLSPWDVGAPMIASGCSNLACFPP